MATRTTNIASSSCTFASDFTPRHFEAGTARDRGPEGDPPTDSAKLDRRQARTAWARAVTAGDVVIAAVRRPGSMDELVAAYPDQVDVVALDVTDLARVDDVVADVTARHGRIDVLVNNAGRTHVGALNAQVGR